MFTQTLDSNRICCSNHGGRRSTISTRLATGGTTTLSLRSACLTITWLAICWFFQGATSYAQDFDQLTLPQLERQLNAILKTRLDEEKAYITSIIKLVEEEKLPRHLVFISFKYVRNKKPDTRYPFVYFVRVLVLLAEREKIKVPEFDFSIYSQRR